MLFTVQEHYYGDTIVMCKETNREMIDYTCDLPVARKGDWYEIVQPVETP
jgi:hypothetical protein